MVTSNDRAFCILVACDNDIGMKKMPYFMYLMQVAGFEVNYRYTIRTDRIRSHGLSKDVNLLTSMGILDNSYGVTDKGGAELSKYYITAYDDSLCDMVVDYVRDLDIHDLYVLCVVDIIVMETLSNSGYEGLIKNKPKMLEDIRYLCGEVPDNVFDFCIGVMRKIRNRRNERA